MTKPKPIFSQEKIEALRKAAQSKNPNKSLIAILELKRSALTKEIHSLISDEEKYLNIMTMLSNDFDSKEAAVKCMEDEELFEHVINIFYPLLQSELDESILNELLDRAGYKP